MNFLFIIAQVFGVMGMILIVSSYFQKDKKQFLILQSSSNVAYGLQYLCLGANSGLALAIVSIVKNIYFYKNEKKKKENPVWLLIFFIVIVVIVTYLTYDSWISWLPCLITILFTFGSWHKNLKTAYLVGIISSLMWFVYNFYVGAYVAMASSLIECVSAIIGLVNLCKSDKKENIKCEIVKKP